MEVEIKNCCDLELTATAPYIICGATNSIITANAAKGTAPFEYALDGGSYQTDNTFNVKAGTYKISAKDATGCTTETTLIVKQTVVDISISEVITSASCGEKNGAVNISIGGSGTAPYSFKWTGPNNFSTQVEDLTGVESGNYTVEVTDANGCSNTKIITVNNTTASINISEQVTDATCTGKDGAINITVSGTGTVPYSFIWTGPGTNAISEDLSALDPGDYTVEVTDAKGCKASKTISVKNTTASINISEVVTDATCTGKDGAINITVSGTGTVPYTYKWTGPATNASSEDLAGLDAGDYTVEVTDAKGCKTTKTISVKNTAATINISEVVTDATCTGKDGAINITVTGTGIVPYSFKWTGPSINSSSEDIAGLDAGDYAVEVTDAKGCKFAKTIRVNNAFASIIISEVVINTRCGGNNGAINITITGTGKAPYTYNWTGPNNYSASTEDLKDIGVGSFTVEVTDANGCKLTRTINVSDISNNIVLSATAPDISCTVTTGTITVAASGGIAPYNYTLNGGPVQTNNVFNNLSAGSYKINVKDANGCSTDLDVILKQLPSDLKATAVSPDIACNANDGKITINASGGTSPYNYSLNGGSYQPSNEFNGLKAGLYKIIVKDAGGCIAELYVNIKEQCCKVLLAVSATDITCAQSTATITVSASNGVAPYQYALDAGSYQSGNTFPVNKAGDYKITVKDSKGCIVEAMVTVIEVKSDLSVIAVAPDITCSQTTGSITATPIKGRAPHVYSIDGGPFQPGNNFNNLPAGLHNIAVKDALGCLATTSSQLKQVSSNPNLVITDPAPVCAPGIVDITASAVTAGSDPGLSLSYWTNPSANTPIPDPTAITSSGTYYIKGIEVSGCSDIKAVKVSILNSPKMLVTDPKPSCASVDITAPSITAGSDPDLSFSYWKDANATDPLPNPASVNVNGTYYIKAGPAQCFSIKPVKVTVIRT
jgi:hypothetical protein